MTTFPIPLLLLAVSVPVLPAPAQTNDAVSPGLARCTTPVPREGAAYERFLLLNQRAKEAGENARLIFIGDSITQGWETGGKQVWEKYYAPRNALNLGIGSDHTQHILWRLENGNVDGLKPQVAVLLLGVNNAPEPANNTPADILAGVQAVVRKTREKLPETKILLLGIFPWKEDFHPLRGKILQVNQALQKLDDGKTIFYLDIGHLFLDDNGRIPKHMMRDAVHPSAEGYKIWARAMEPKLAELVGEKPVAP